MSDGSAEIRGASCSSFDRSIAGAAFAGSRRRIAIFVVGCVHDARKSRRVPATCVGRHGSVRLEFSTL